jgi:type I restriction enzyme R subunit
MIPYSKDILVQQTIAEYHQQQLGWESIYACNNEDFGPDSLLDSTSDREVVLTFIMKKEVIV